MLPTSQIAQLTQYVHVLRHETSAVGSLGTGIFNHSGIARLALDLAAPVRKRKRYIDNVLIVYVESIELPLKRAIA